MSAASRRGKPKVPTTWSEVLARCPFRTLIGKQQPGVDAQTASSLLPHLMHTFVALGGDPEPIAGETIAELVASIQAGGTVLVMADRADLRDYAKREILALVGPVEGCA